MDKPFLKEVLWSRTFTVGRSKTKKVVASMGMPFLDDGAWCCRFEILGPDYCERAWSEGFDTLQALLIGLQMISLKIASLNETRHSGELRWLGNPELGLLESADRERKGMSPDARRLLAMIKSEMS